MGVKERREALEPSYNILKNQVILFLVEVLASRVTRLARPKKASSVALLSFSVPIRGFSENSKDLISLRQTVNACLFGLDRRRHL